MANEPKPTKQKRCPVWKYTDCRLTFSDDLCPIDGKAAQAGDMGKCGNALSENQTDAWAAKNVIERIEVLRVMAAPFFAY